MAFALVHNTQTAASSVTSIPITVTAVTQGNLVVVSFKFNSATAPTGLGVTDNAGNVYAQAVGPITNNNLTSYIWYGVAVNGGATTVTVSWTGSSTLRVEVDEFSGNASSNAAVFDVANSSVGTSTAPQTTLSPVANGELVVVAGIFASTGTVTAGTGYTDTSSANNSVSVGYKLSGTTSETPGFTLGTSQAWTALAAAFKPSSGGGAVVHELSLLGVGV